MHRLPSRGFLSRQIVRTLVLLALVVAAWQGSEAEARHRVVLQGKGQLVVLGKDGSVEWSMEWPGIHDLHVLPQGNLMVQQGSQRVVEIDRETKQVVWTYDSSTQNGNAGTPLEVHAFQPLGPDRLMIAETGVKRFIEVDRQGRLLKQTPMKVDRPHPHTDTRIVRKLDNGNYLACHEGDGVLREYDGTTDAVVWEYAVPLFGKEPADGHGPEAFGNKLFSAVRLANGNTLVATGNGHSVLEVTPAKEIVWQIHQNDLPGITLAWVTTLQVLPNGNYVIGNCHAGPGQPILVEVDPRTKQVVWQLDGFDRFGNDVSNSVVLPD
jgi:outer membrane protein assembly factor BamB